MKVEALGSLLWLCSLGLGIALYCLLSSCHENSGGVSDIYLSMVESGSAVVASLYQAPLTGGIRLGAGPRERIMRQTILCQVYHVTLPCQSAAYHAAPWVTTPHRSMLDYERETHDTKLHRYIQISKPNVRCPATPGPILAFQLGPPSYPK